MFMPQSHFQNYQYKRPTKSSTNDQNFKPPDQGQNDYYSHAYGSQNYTLTK